MSNNQPANKNKNLIITMAVLSLVVVLAVVILIIIGQNKGKKSTSSEAKQESIVGDVESKEPQEGKGDTPESEAEDAEAPAEEDASSAEDSADPSQAADVEQQAVASTVQFLDRPSILKDFYDLVFEPEQPKVASTKTEDPDTLYNAEQFYLQDDQKALIEDNGFFVQRGYSKEFFSIYESNRYALIPNFVTVDSMMHTYHLYFAYLMKKTERTSLAPQLQELSLLMLEKSKAQYEELKGTAWEKGAMINVAFFAVGATLMGESPDVPSEVNDLVQSELALVEDAAGIAPSPLLGIEEDYSQYIPRGYYDTDENLTRYFKAMMWYGRRNFILKDDDQTRAAILMTLAMDEDTLPIWEGIYTVTAFFAGASDDSGYYEYRPIIDAAFGEDLSLSALASNAEGLENFKAIAAELDPPKINSVPVYESDTEEEKAAKIIGFRFMGQRFTLDEAIFTQLCFRNTQENPDGAKRMLPDALDVPAALGSDAALSILEEQGDTKYANYPEKMQELRTMIAEAPEDTWNASLYAGWLNTLRPLLEVKGEGYPSFMQTEAWTRKNLMTFLGSYTELKHDTILYAKQMIAEMGGGELPEWDDRGYVEPEAEVYARLSALVRATSSGLEHYGILASEDKESLALLAELSDSLQTISEKELREETLTDEEYELIRTYGGQLEHFWQEATKDDAENEFFTADDFPAAIVADIATDPNGSCLEVGTGNPARIVVVVRVDGVLKLAQGSIYSFYQFKQPIDDRLTDTKWRQMMGIELTDDGTYVQEPAVDIPDWVRSFWYEYQY